MAKKAVKKAVKRAAKKKAAPKPKVPDEPVEHFLIPKHEKLSEQEKQDLCSEFGVVIKQLPKIAKSDPAIKHMEDLVPGDVLKITRISDHSGVETYYRGVIDA